MNEQEAKQQAAALVQRIKKEPEFMYNSVGWDAYKFLTTFAGESGPIPGKQLILPFIEDDSITPEEQVLRDFTLASDICDDNVNIHTTKDGKTGVIITIYEVGDHYYTEAEFNELRPEFNKKPQEVHDKKIYEDKCHWMTAPTHIGEFYFYPVSATTNHLLERNGIGWRTDENGRHFIFETDLDIKWEE